MGESKPNPDALTQNSNLVLKAISELKGYSFIIPYQQRGYKWTKNNITLLLDDLNQFIKSNEERYCLQPVAVVEKEDNGNTKYSVIDGQQRLTSLYLIYKYLVADGKVLEEKEELFHYEYERDTDNERKAFLRNEIDREVDTNIDFFYMSRAYLAIKEWFEKEKDENGNSIDKEKLKKDFVNLIDAPKEASKDSKSIQVIWYLVETEKEHEIFRNINSGKIQLTNSDLIKALLLKRGSDIQNQEQIAAQFEQMERQFAEDRFWYMLQQKDVDYLKGQSRIDLLFNMVAGIEESNYIIEPRSSFFKFANYPSTKLLEMWKDVREKFQRIKDLFDDPYTFHYLGFLIYCGKKLSCILNEYANNNKKAFITYLKDEIKGCFSNTHTTLDEYNYADSKDALRRVFIMHNIETILQRYENLNKELNLRFTYEYFPFELLYSQKWDIEHIASQTENELKSNEDRQYWIASILVDYADILDEETKKNCDEVKEKLNNRKEDCEKQFNALFSKIVEEIEGKELQEEEKNGIGNLVLLDSHTNRSFHNSLFLKKRKIVITASGLRNDNDKNLNLNEVQSVYVPICTQQVYTKSYNKQHDVKLNAWTKDDYDAYLVDMKEKLKDYFEENQ